jgi:hypothetical protein
MRDCETKYVREKKRIWDESCVGQEQRVVGWWGSLQVSANNNKSENSFWCFAGVCVFVSAVSESAQKMEACCIAAFSKEAIPKKAGCDEMSRVWCFIACEIGNWSFQLLFQPFFSFCQQFWRITKAVGKKMVAGCGVNELLQRRWARWWCRYLVIGLEVLGRDQTSGPETTSQCCTGSKKIRGWLREKYYGDTKGQRNGECSRR